MRVFVRWQSFMIHNQLFAAKRWRASTGPAAARPAEPFGRGAQPLKGLPAVAKRAKAEGLSLMNYTGASAPSIWNTLEMGVLNAAAIL